MLFLMFLLMSPASSRAETLLRAELTAGGAARAEYRFESRRADDLSEVKNSFSSAEGKALLREELRYHGGELRSYQLEQLQVGDRGRIEIRDGKVTYTFTRDGKTVTSAEDSEEKMLVPDSIPAFVRKNWEALLIGETVKARLLVLDRQESIGMKFYVDRKTDQLVEIVMKPSSFVIALFAPKHRFAFETAPARRVVFSEGRWPVFRPKGDAQPAKYKDWRPVEGRLDFQRQ